MAKMSGEKGGLVGATISRTVVEGLAKRIAKLSIAEDIISQLRGMVDQAAGGKVAVNAVREWVNRLNPVSRTLVEPFVDQFLYGEINGEGDDMKKKQSQKATSQNPMIKAMNNISLLPEDLSNALTSAIKKIKPEALMKLGFITISECNKEYLKRIAEECVKQGDKATEYLMAELNLDPKAISGSAGAELSNEQKKLLQEVKGWLFEAELELFKKLHEVLKHEHNDSLHDRPAFEAWLAGFHGYGKEKAISILKAIIEDSTVEELSRIAGVRPNYPTRFIGLLKKPLAWLSKLSEGDYSPGTRTAIRNRYKKTRQELGLQTS